MIRILIVVLWIGLTFSAWGQVQPNPFDLKYRPQHPKAVSPKPVIDSSAAHVPSVKENEVNEPQQVFPNTPDTSSVKLGADTTTFHGSTNPFEVKGDKSSDSTHQVTSNSGNENNPEITPIPHITNKRVSKGIQIFFILLSLLLLIFIVNVERKLSKIYGA